EVPEPIIPEFKTGVEINVDSLVLNVDETTNLTAEIFFLCNYKPEINWTSDDTTVAKVNTSGLVTAVGEGNCNITAQSENGLLTDEIAVVVTHSTAAPALPKTSFQAWIDSNNRLQIFFPDPVQLETVSLFTITGKKVYTKSFPENSFLQQKELNVSGITDGVYLLVVSLKNGVLSQKILKN
ncbi:MAG: Ig-like domain-containing protein, partial [Prolixibacteraceae bacterium]